MNDNERIAGIAAALLANRSPVVLASIVDLQGSSPRHTGTKMLIGADEKSYGTIGGSLLEATAIKESKAVLSAGRSRLMSFEMTGENANSAGMICGGKVEMLLDFIQPTEDNISLFKEWEADVASGQDFYYVTYLKNSGNEVDVAGRSILYKDGRLKGSSLLSGIDLETLRVESGKVSNTAVISIKDVKVVIDSIRKLKTLFLFGAGHVALPTAHIGALAGFRVVVVDDRAEFAYAGRFPEASDIVVIRDFNRAIEGLEINSDSFIVILTRGHQFDRVVLEQVLNTSAGYIGMISSRRKKDAIYEALTAKGVSGEQLGRVHAPIGVPIGGETPEEIAISIVAELISVRNKKE